MLPRRPFALTFAAGLAVLAAAAPGAQAAFPGDRDGDPEVWVMNADGSLPAQVTFTGLITDPPTTVTLPDGTLRTVPGLSYGLDRSPAWSPKAARIAFSTNRAPAKTWEVY